MRQLFHIQKSKKGVSLIYVIIASAALIILSGVVVVSAIRNMNLTSNNNMSRYAYDRDKAAIEYAKGVLEQEYEADSTGGSKLQDFEVTNVTDGHGPYNCRAGRTAIDGTNVFAACEIKKGSDNIYTATITAGYPSSSTNRNKLLKMKYTTHCTLGGGAVDGFQYIMYGSGYGKDNIITKDNNAPTFMEDSPQNPAKTSAYPVVFNLPVQATSGNQSRLLQAPEIFFMGTDYPGASHTLTNDDLKNSALYGSSDGTATIKSDFIYIKSNRIVFKGDSSSLKLEPINNGTGYIYFAQSCDVLKTSTDNLKARDSGVSAINKFNAGLYSYSGTSTDIFRQCRLNFISSTLPDDIKTKYNVDYIKTACDLSGSSNNTKPANGDNRYAPTQPYEGGKADWLKNGEINNSTGGSGANGTNDVYMYVDGSNTDATNAWANGSSPLYTAHQISLLYVTHNIIHYNSAEPLIKIGKANGGSDKKVTFNADIVTLSGQKEDGAGEDNDSLTLEQTKNSGSGFILKDLKDDSGKVTLKLYHKLIVKKDNGTGYSLNAGTYTVDSGTDLFGDDTISGSFTPESGSGSGSDSGGSGSGGGFSGGEYSWPKN